MRSDHAIAPGGLTGPELKDLYGALLGYLSNCTDAEAAWDAANESNSRITPDTLGIDIEMMDCDWCNGTGDFIGFPCYFCLGHGRLPTHGGFRRIIELMRQRRLEQSQNRAQLREWLEIAETIVDEEEWKQFRVERPEMAKVTEPTVAEEIAAIRGEIEELDKDLADRDATLARMVELQRLTRYASRAVRVAPARPPMQRVAPPPKRPQCAVCGRPATVTADDGRPLCKKHGYEIIRRERKVEEAPATATEGTTEPEERRVEMTRPFRFVGGPLDGQMHPVPRGETYVTIEGHRYMRRGHAFEWMEG